MQVKVRRYRDSDFARLRELLVETFALYGGPFNWSLERLNFTRYFAAPVHTFYSARCFDAPVPQHRGFRDEVRAWERNVWLWENAAGRLVAAVHSDNEGPGRAFFQLHPDFTGLYGDMLDHAEDNLADVARGVSFLNAHVNDGTELERLVEQRGYIRSSTHNVLRRMVMPMEPPGRLPEGLRFATVAEVDDVAERSRAKALAFSGYCEPSGWPPAWAFEELSRAPDYRPDLDLMVLTARDECVAFATIWLDQHNHYANFEPVGTRVDYQGQGLGAALLQEGFHRMSQLGVTSSYMDSRNPFYLKQGFRQTLRSYSAWVRYW